MFSRAKYIHVSMVYVCKYACKYVCMYVCMYVFIFVYHALVQSVLLLPATGPWSLAVASCIFRALSPVHIYIYIYICIHICIHISVSACKSMYKYMYVCMYVCIYEFTFRPVAISLAVTPSKLPT